MPRLPSHTRVQAQGRHAWLMRDVCVDKERGRKGQRVETLLFLAISLPCLAINAGGGRQTTSEVNQARAGSLPLLCACVAVIIESSVACMLIIYEKSLALILFLHSVTSDFLLGANRR